MTDKFGFWGGMKKTLVTTVMVGVSVAVVVAAAGGVAWIQVQEEANFRKLCDFQGCMKVSEQWVSKSKIECGMRWVFHTDPFDFLINSRIVLCEKFHCPVSYYFQV